MWNDPIIEELHKIRANRSAEFNHDLRLMANALKSLEQEWLSKHPELDYRLLSNAKMFAINK
ncbi:hypothetical protein [Synechococcus sp. PCC 6312]|uniref:hypothetical protein n=1 Tax=Synechococcus sp. (strain ATCC 27167 / PCC 6312) TaxID=195253 RepID=UPI00029EEA40|nr:hypothetical protein [Synechococcus sp. PCC 6312]AFY60091.1 hypothetical protein Syn6312_0883 [Synechococcus sp. PCC 6312]